MKRAVPACTDLQVRHLRGGGIRRLEVLAAREHEPDGTLQRERRTDRERLDERELPAEGPTQRLGDHANALEREVEGARDLPPGDERALRARGDDERARGLEPGGARPAARGTPGRPMASGTFPRRSRHSRRSAAAISPRSRVTRSSTLPESSPPGSSSWPWSTPAWIDSRSPASSSVSSTCAGERAPRAPWRPRRRRPRRAARSRRRQPRRRPRRRPRSRRRRAPRAGPRRRPPRGRAAPTCGRCRPTRWEGRTPTERRRRREPRARRPSSTPRIRACASVARTGRACRRPWT